MHEILLHSHVAKLSKVMVNDDHHVKQCVDNAVIIGVASIRLWGWHQATDETGRSLSNREPCPYTSVRPYPSVDNTPDGAVDVTALFGSWAITVGSQPSSGHSNNRCELHPAQL